MNKFFCVILSVLCLVFIAAECGAAERIALMLEGADPAAVPNGFNGQCAEGLQMAQSRYGRRLQTKIYNALADRAAIEPLLREASAASDLVIVTSARYVPALTAVKDEFPDCRYIVFDCDVPGVTAIQFREEEGAFLAGALAALMTRETDVERINGAAKIGIIIGEDVPPTQRLLLGYRAGAWYVSPEVEVLREFTGSFRDASAVEAAARRLSEAGSDVIFCAAGTASTGAIIHAPERGYWCIGVDVELEHEFPNSVLASVVKRSSLVVAKVIENYISGELPDGSFPLGLEYGCIDLSTWTREAKMNIPIEVQDEIDDIAEKIKSGLIIINGDDFGGIKAD